MFITGLFWIWQLSAPLVYENEFHIVFLLLEVSQSSAYRLQSYEYGG